MAPALGVIECCFGKPWRHEDRKRVLTQLSLIAAATRVASYRNGTAYACMRAFREAARTLAGAELAPMLEEDLHALQDLGIDRLGDERPRLRQRSLAVRHPMAAEVVRWLDGADTVDSWVEVA